MKGTVNWFNHKKGYGFIKAENGEDVFIHISEVKEKDTSLLEEGKVVEFEVSQGKKGLQANNLNYSVPDISINNLCVPRDSKKLLEDKSDISNYNLKLNKYLKYTPDKEHNFEYINNYKFKNNNIFSLIEKRQKRILDNYDEDRKYQKKAVVNWRMIVGLGSAHVDETSMTLHHTYGVPYIPSSAIKGSLRNYFITKTFEKYFSELDDKEIVNLEDILLKLDEYEEKIEYFEKKDINGKLKNYFIKNEDKDNLVVKYRNYFGNNKFKGRVIYLDTFPIDKVNVEKDIMTNHYGDYYNGEAPPTDDQIINPVPFFSVKDTSFKFNIILSDNFNDKYKDDFKNLFNEMLKKHGLGAKTAVGYGYFNDINKKKKSNKKKSKKTTKKKNNKSTQKRVSFSELMEKMD